MRGREDTFSPSQADVGRLFYAVVKTTQPQWRWGDGAVEDREEHIELRHGKVAEALYEDWLPVARIGKPKRHVFPVHWLVKPDSTDNLAIISDARQELDFYLVEKGERDPWRYAQYHCSTGANIYSSVHWSYFPDGRSGDRVASTVTERPVTTPRTSDPFTDRALKIYEDAKTQIGYVAHRFRQKIVRDGGLAAAKHWLRPAKATAGFQRLLDHDRLDLSVEAVVQQTPWDKLFTPAELATARKRLRQFGYFTRPATRATPSTQFSADELADDANYLEGAKTQITVSAYERNLEARRRCIRHYGATCYVCGFDFADTYGDIGLGFIHVHHLTPFAALAGPHDTDPVADLRPVCPNCHAMLHRRNPPIPIAELKGLVRSARPEGHRK